MSDTVIINGVEYEIAWALNEVLDGVKPHDLPDQLGCDEKTCRRIIAACDAARAYLAQPGGPQPVPTVPTEEELAKTAEKVWNAYKYSTDLPYFLYTDEREPLMMAFRAILSEHGNRPTEPVMVVGDFTESGDLPPRVGHILRLAEIIREVDGNNSLGASALSEAILSHSGSYRMVSAVLARCGHQPPQPIPLSERLPGPEDCDAEGKCWWSHDESCDDPWKDGSLPCDPKWILRVDGPTSSAWAERTNRHVPCVHPTHWLPHHALPLPEAP